MTELSFHPGEHIQEELDELGLSSETFAMQLGVPVAALLAILHGQQSLDAEFALRLGHFFNTSAQFWINLQTGFDLEQAKRLHGAEIDALPTLQAA